MLPLTLLALALPPTAANYSSAHLSDLLAGGREECNGKQPSEVSEPSATCVHTSLSKQGKKERTGERGRRHRDMTEVEASLGEVNEGPSRAPSLSWIHQTFVCLKGIMI